MNPVLLAAAAAATVYYLSKKPQSKDWKAFVNTLGVVSMESKIDFCKSVVSLQDPKTTKIETSFTSWASAHLSLGEAILIDTNIQSGTLSTEQSVKAYAVDPKKVAELISNGTFVEYKP
jgi:hypothetical protein